jgi:C4-dicarboxylate-specific signal transduction histidine kinase
METRLRSKNSNWFPAEVGSRPLPFHDQEALVVTIRDITARKKAEDLIQKKNDELNSINAELQSANDKLRDAYSRLRDAHQKRKSIEEQLILAEKRASLGTMAAGIAHEIAQPLNGLKIMVDGMEYWFRQGKKIEFPIIREKLKKVSNHANRINEIISYMRAVYRNRETVNLERVDLNQSIKGAVAMIASACEDEEIRIELSLAKDLPQILAQPLQAEQIVLNLTQNSIQALRGIESNDRWIQIKTWVSRETVRFRIGDNGVGLGQEIGRIFDPFYTTHEAGGGMGLGLCIVQNLISAWNGKIRASNRKKGGAYFSIELPIAQSAESMLKDGVQAKSRDGT